MTTPSRVIVVGDKKSPKEYNCKKVIFLPYDIKLGFKLENVLPYNHYCRKMLGYLYSMQEGAEIIYDTDDDNKPLDNWELPIFNGTFNEVFSPDGFINVYKFYTSENIWPRGYPLELIRQNKELYLQNQSVQKNIEIGIWQSLTDNEPDVDVIYRLTDNRLINFKKKDPIVLSKGTVCPFNSQATAFRKELFPLLYLPTTVTFRFTDILRGLIAQPIMWDAGYNLGFTAPMVVQKRNDHNYLNDFELEIPCYLLAQKVVNIAKKSISKKDSIFNNLQNIYEALSKENIVDKNELITLEAWINDTKNLLKSED
ncbi:MAG: STELLO glycosyltransferase family protein [Candidatus Gastranaerophilales bacterium]|nr:STELLO glycosyltransferase family protein [Candidatus Gastranaerophilales bacterium]